MRKVLFVGLLVLLAGCALTSKVGKQFPPDGHYLRVTKASLINHIPRTLTWDNVKIDYLPILDPLAEEVNVTGNIVYNFKAGANIVNMTWRLYLLDANHVCLEQVVFSRGSASAGKPVPFDFSFPYREEYAYMTINGTWQWY